MFGYSSVTESLAASQEGLSFIHLVIYTSQTIYLQTKMWKYVFFYVTYNYIYKHYDSYARPLLSHGSVKTFPKLRSQI
jgi:hypothetical protein